jgi:hypothetical protein
MRTIRNFPSLVFVSNKEVLFVKKKKKKKVSCKSKLKKDLQFVEIRVQCKNHQNTNA